MLWENETFVCHPIRQHNIIILTLTHNSIISYALWSSVQKTLNFINNRKNMTHSKTAIIPHKGKVSYTSKTLLPMVHLTRLFCLLSNTCFATKGINLTTKGVSFQIKHCWVKPLPVFFNQFSERWEVLTQCTILRIPNEAAEPKEM